MQSKENNTESNFRVITTFNDDLYRNSGKAFLKTVERVMPEAELLIYEELEKGLKEDINSIKVTELPKFKEVFENHKDVISSYYGGNADRNSKTQKLAWEWQYRWFGWFRKIAAQHHAITVNKYKGYNVFFDCDVRITKKFTKEYIRSKLNGKPMGVFKGDRGTVEAALVIVDGESTEAQEIYEYIMNLFVSGEFKKLDRWDDSFVFADIMNARPHSMQDLAEGVSAREYTNSNGHFTGGHVIPFTEWGEFFEHDKGIHWRQGAVPKF